MTVLGSVLAPLHIPLASVVAMSEVSVGALFIRLILSLGVVIGLMALAAAAMRRLGTGRLGGDRRSSKPLRIEIISRQPLGRRASVAVVRAGDRGFVLGVTEQNVTLIAETAVDELITLEAPRTVPTTDGSRERRPDVEPAWKGLTEQLRDRTVRRS